MQTANPARAALSRAVNAAIANGAKPVFNVPPVNEHDRDIPPGKVLKAERLDPADRRAKSEVLDVKTGWGRTRVELTANHAGWACAGSVMRWDNGSYGVRWESGGATHGRRYRTFGEALDHFNRIPA
jgi:hypothetical protein